MPVMTGEFAAIDAIRRRLPGPPDPTQVWIGDDAAVLPGPGGVRLLLAADTMVEGVHAAVNLVGLEAFGWKAMAACISDIAAMGGSPGHAVVTVAGPAGTDLLRLYDGLAAASAEYACPIVGGDLANAPVLVVTVTVTGTCDGSPVLRRGARPGDGVWVTGPLGRSAAGLRYYRLEKSGGERLKAAHARPAARLEAGRAARVAGATSMIDVSDGLTADIGHLADMSGVGFELSRVPVAEGATLEEALGGGEDFELVFTAPGSAPIGECFEGLSPPIRIGEVTAAAGRLTLAGRSLERTGWQHRW
jgi:thiamine-monophosphate kinase